ncbi:hypothetical protein BpHYR1_045775 [Brachionus plicatilis]|uniref:Uncharacterized protein n=1 Tax=Brachionus plicatilis TaxID=10195 RepID=A0A3M7RDA3_BRAPC|nr:hypothetical protein BpHYR1_045775 [Brachionus plicatilis]
MKKICLEQALLENRCSGQLGSMIGRIALAIECSSIVCLCGYVTVFYGIFFRGNACILFIGQETSSIHNHDNNRSESRLFLSFLQKKYFFTIRYHCWEKIELMKAYANYVGLITYYYF